MSRLTLTDKKLARYLSYAVAAILVALPVSTLLTTWAGANSGHFDLFKIWKELLLVPIGLAALWLAKRDKQLNKRLHNDILIYLILLYVFTQIVLGLSSLINGKVNSSALIYSWLVNSRFLVFFIICFIVAAKDDWLKKYWKRLVLVPAAVVLIFGLLQAWVLPANFLAHFGYGPKTITAVHTIDQKPEYIRLQSTLRGPNPLGAYLVIIISLLAALLYGRRAKTVRAPLLLAVSIVILLFTYSRSAWLGAVLSVCVLSFWALRNHLARRWVLAGAASSVVVAVGLVVVFRDNNFVQNTLFHTDETSQSAESSNAARASALESGAVSLLHEPFGRGPGTAGPASFRNDKPARIAENYFIQIGQEVGLIGLALFLAIYGIVARRLWLARQDLLPAVLLASLAGITLINMLSHAWTDDTLALLWWGLAGLALARHQPAFRQSR